MTQSTAQTDWRLAHGVAFILLMACALAFPVLRRWPWVWLAPFVTYFVLVVCVSRLRRSMSWLRVGRLSLASITTTIAVMALTVLALVLFHTTVQPDVSDYRAAIPFDALGGVIIAGVVFTIVNATLEELVFRGVLFDALQSQWGVWVTLAATASTVSSFVQELYEVFSHTHAAKHNRCTELGDSASVPYRSPLAPSR
jgi:membrane protease YdiL (CAAX protease family)